MYRKSAQHRNGIKDSSYSVKYPAKIKTNWKRKFLSHLKDSPTINVNNHNSDLQHKIYLAEKFVSKFFKTYFGEKKTLTRMNLAIEST